MESKAVRDCLEREGFRPDIIHSHYTWPSGAVAIELKKSMHVPVVVAEHTSITLNRFLDSRDPIALRTWKNADATIRVNKLDISRIREVAGVPASCVHYIPNGFSENEFYPIAVEECRKKLGLPLDKKVILNVANPCTARLKTISN